MNKQRKVVITTTYNDLGVIIDTKAEELDSSTQPNLQLTCNQLATDTISRQAAKEAVRMVVKDLPTRTEINILINDLPSAQPERKTGKWEIYVISMFDGEGCRCSECGFEGAPYWDYCPNCGSYNGGEQDG